ncbi:hypothetical protein D9M69_113290 [compost metagenome]
MSLRKQHPPIEGRSYKQHAMSEMADEKGHGHDGRPWQYRKGLSISRSGKVCT